MTDNELDKLKKSLGKDTVKELEELDATKLKAEIIVSEQSMKQAKQELEANKNYTGARSILNDLRSGLNAVNKRQRAKIQMALHLIEAKGK